MLPPAKKLFTFQRFIENALLKIIKFFPRELALQTAAAIGKVLHEFINLSMGFQ